jgi:hypothetical protein
MSEEKELLCGKIVGMFYHPSLTLTSKRLIIGERSISLNEIVKVDSKKEKTQSKMIIHLKNGKIEEVTVSPEKTPLVAASLSGNMNGQDDEMKPRSEATTEKWVSTVNSCLSIEETKEIPQSLSQEAPPAQPVPETVSVNKLEDEERVARYFRNFSVPVSEPISQKTAKRSRENSAIAKRLRILKSLLEDSLITEDDFEKRKTEILSEI